MCQVVALQIKLERRGGGLDHADLKRSKLLPRKHRITPCMAHFDCPACLGPLVWIWDDVLPCHCCINYHRNLPTAKMFCWLSLAKNPNPKPYMTKARRNGGPIFLGLFFGGWSFFFFLGGGVPWFFLGKTAVSLRFGRI